MYLVVEEGGDAAVVADGSVGRAGGRGGNLQLILVPRLLPHQELGHLGSGLLVEHVKLVKVAGCSAKIRFLLFKKEYTIFLKQTKIKKEPTNG